ncbi:cation-translocating P-type ATPase [Flavihumibacter solisilvae]|uniref:ATPase n=1 Tax=Flavihumibacter solisilvae TaxID=1349421 RepID=A0A0C1L027_9BACT|nr:cation-translocating P-type ATPase [Flavihumibacter solisilvae]KIC93337.1 ATPase [Flavihumibacter solisilvae]
MKPWHTLSVDDVLKETGSSLDGLDDEAVQQKTSEFGKNELQTSGKVHPVMIFIRQFIDVMILVLVVAAIVSAFIGELSDTIVILVIIILNAVIGFFQEYRAEQAMEALKKMAAPFSNVVRNGSISEIPAADIVPGDIVLLEAGDLVPADMRLIEIHSLKINEASLTGESQAIDKTINTCSTADISLGDRTNLAFRGTHVTNGRGKGVVVETGMKTELGKIAGMLEKAESSTPLQKRLKDFSSKLTVIIILLCIGLFMIGYLRGEEFNRMLLTSISLAVAAIPEALPAVVTVSLALGARRLMKQNALIRKLYAVEGLGSVTFICTDKTGTLTKNQMIVQEIWVPDEKRKEAFMQAMSLNHDLKEKDGKKTGDPTELAMVEYAKTTAPFKRVEEIPFDSERKAMTTIHEREGKYWVITKGAAEAIMNMSRDVQLVEEIKKQEEKLAMGGMRVIGFGAKLVDKLPDEISPDNVEKDLEFLGLAGLIDPPRDEAKQAIRKCKTAGIVPVMITGDHPLTAATIAKELGIIEHDDHKVITGQELGRKEEREMEQEVLKIRVYARVSPEQKLKIVDGLQKKEQFVSMTGDGVNDAPSLKKANIGVAMGITGTEVTKEAAHMILLDDNFATIVRAVEEGRRIYDNIRKFIKYILTGNAAEIWTIFLAPFFGLPIPLLPVHILWINLVTDGLPALALAAEKEEQDTMNRPPRKTGESVFAKGLGIHVMWVGLFIGLLTIGTQWYAMEHGMKNWQTMVFTVLCFSQLWHVMAIRSETRSLFRIGVWSNVPLILAVLLTVIMQFMIIYLPELGKFFHVGPLTFPELLIAVGVSMVVFIAVEVEKFFKRRLRAGK